VTRSAGQPFSADVARALRAAADAQRAAADAQWAHAEALEVLSEVLLAEEGQKSGPSSAVNTGALLTVKEVMSLLGMSKTWVYRAINEGRLPYVQLGDKRHVRPEDLEAFIESRHVDGDTSTLASEARRGPSLYSANGYDEGSQASEGEQEAP